jgi:diketogulonate reductase-like aldo/keto reductase
MVNQTLAHISSRPHELIRLHAGGGNLVEPYSPIARGELLKNERVREIAAAKTMPVFGGTLS